MIRPPVAHPSRRRLHPLFLPSNRCRRRLRLHLRRARAWWKILLPVLFVGIAVGVWLFLGDSVKSDVNEFIVSSRQFAEASRLRSSGIGGCCRSVRACDEIAQKWWAQLQEPPANQDQAAVQKSLDELNAFEAAFPGHEGIKARTALIWRAWPASSVFARVDELLKANEIDAARTALAKDQASSFAGCWKARCKCVDSTTNGRLPRL